MEEPHQLLKELLQICSVHNIDPAKAHLIFECYLELCEVRKLHELDYHFNKFLKMFYLMGKKEKSDETADVYIPVILQDSLNLSDIENMQEQLTSGQNKFYLFIKDRDSTSTCYQVTKGLLKPNSPLSTKEKKDLEFNKYHLEKNLQLNRKKLYTKALKNMKS